MDELIKILKAMRQITPDARFVQQCRYNVLNAAQLTANNRGRKVKLFLKQSLSFALGIGLAAVFIYFIASSFQVNSQSAVTQRQPSPKLDIRLEKARYYKEIAPNVYIVVLEDN